MSDVKTVYQIPGPRGATGISGTNGTNGINAYATTTGAFTMPAELASVTVAVDESAWAAVGQNVYVNGAGYFEVEATGTLQMTLKNLEDTANSMYVVNVAPGTVIATGKRVSPAGLQGPAGA
jgi:hypothetical protein